MRGGGKVERDKECLYIGLVDREKENRKEGIEEKESG